jgi:parvulin-like peptidyl-prolyl isomerase
LKIIGTFAAASTAIMLAGCGGGGSSDAVATINGKSLSMADYQKQMETLNTVTVVLPNGQTVNARPAQPISTQAMGKLIESQIILAAAKDEGVLPSKEDVEKEKTLQTTLNPQFQDQMRAVGYTGEGINQAILEGLALYRLSIKGQPEKTIADAEKYVKENPSKFKQPPTATLRWIVLSNPSQKETVDRELINSTFGAAAAKYSAVPTAKVDNGAFNPVQGGRDPRPVPVSEALGPEFYKAITQTKEGGTSPWFKMNDRWVKIEVESKTPSQQMKPSAGQLELLRRSLTQQEAKGAVDVQKILLDELLSADVKVYPAYLKKNWDTMFTMLKQRTAEMGATPSSATVGTKPGAPGTEKDKN